MLSPGRNRAEVSVNPMNVLSALHTHRLNFISEPDFVTIHTGVSLGIACQSEISTVDEHADKKAIERKRPQHIWRVDDVKETLRDTPAFTPADEKVDECGCLFKDRVPGESPIYFREVHVHRRQRQEDKHQNCTKNKHPRLPAGGFPVLDFFNHPLFENMLSWRTFS